MMFDEHMIPGLFEGNDIYYETKNDKALFNGAYAPILENEDHIGEGVMDVLKGIAPMAAKAIGNIGNHLMNKSNEGAKLSREERKENQAQLRKMLNEEKDPELRKEILNMLRI